MPTPASKPYVLLTGIALLLNACAADDPPDGLGTQAVKIGGSPTLDACGAGAVLEELGQVAVRAAPAPDAQEVDLIPGGQIVWLCDEAPGWRGVVYSRDELEDCGVSTPLADKIPYIGLCRSGWIESAEVTLLAG